MRTCRRPSDGREEEWEWKEREKVDQGRIEEKRQGEENEGYEVSADDPVKLYVFVISRSCFIEL